VGHREQLLAAARRLLEERGYAHITARDLVAASGTNLASIGYHFGSKDALLNEAVAAACRDWAEQLGALAMSAPEATPLERASASWIATLEQLPEQTSTLQAYVEALAQAWRVPALRAQLAEHYRQVRARIAALVAASLGDELAADDPRCTAVATLMVAACDGLALQSLLDPDGAPKPADLAAGLAVVWAASVPPTT
jgi:AcrR family transcriptional regulator